MKSILERIQHTVSDENKLGRQVRYAYLGAQEMSEFCEEYDIYIRRNAFRPQLVVSMNTLGNKHSIEIVGVLRDTFFKVGE